MFLYNFLKKTVKFLFPERILDSVKKVHYLKTLEHFKIEYEKDLIFVNKLVKEGDFVIDVGANIGVYTKYLSKYVGPKGNVLSIEPILSTYNYLTNNVKKMELKNVNTLNIALSNDSSSVRFQIPSGPSGQNYFRARIVTNDIAKRNSTLIVNAVRLDDLIKKDNQKMSFIKIDVEGYEYYVLLGAMNTIDSFKPSLLIEVEGDPSEKNSKAEQVFNLLKSRSYEPYIVLNERLKKWAVGERAFNYFFLRENHLKMINNSPNTTL